MRGSSRPFRAALALSLLCLGFTPAGAQPVPLRPGVLVRAVAPVQGAPVRLAVDPVSRDLYVLMLDGNVHRIPPPYVGQAATLAHAFSEHGFTGTFLGMAFGPDGTLYLVGNRADDTYNTAAVIRGRPRDEGRRTWSVVARTVPYQRSNTSSDHNVNGIAVSPDGAYLYVNSGSRTDHGEVKDAGGAFPGLREVPLTSAILRISSDALDLELPNDEAALKQGGYLYADGVRNSFDLAFDGAGRLFATENAGDRDDPDELNWIREGRHYGFPWRMGLNDTPQQFPGYAPETDLLLSKEPGAIGNGPFENDPAYPPPPAGVVFTDPIRNVGPDADLFRDAADGSVRDAGLAGVPMATFTPHRSPLGLMFDTSDALPGAYRGGAFVVGWTGADSPLLAPFADEGGDLLHLRLAPVEDGYEAEVTRIVKDFKNPIDAAQVGDRLYVVESSGDRIIWEVSFGSSVSAGNEAPGEDPAVVVTPNPLAGLARIELNGFPSQRVSVSLFDVLGRRAATLFEGYITGGKTALELDATRLAPGQYILRVEGEHASVSQSVHVIR